MSEFTQKQSEWDHQASADDVKKQVCRPFTDKDWDDLVTDIRDKLSLNKTSLTNQPATRQLNSILDVGCGNALVLSHLASHFERVSGIDYGQTMVKNAKQLLPQGTFKQGEAKVLDFGDSSFDRVLCYSIFHYFPDQDYVYQAIEEMIRVTKPGGLILIGDLLDNTVEQAFKAASDMEYEKTLPLILRYSQWLFCDLGKIKQDFEQKYAAKGLRIEILPQPDHFKLNHYRKDLRIWC